MPKLTPKNQVTIPKVIRDRLGIGPGDPVEFVEEEGVIVLRRAEARPSFREYRGFLKRFLGRSTEEIMEELRGSPDDLVD